MLGAECADCLSAHGRGTRLTRWRASLVRLDGMTWAGRGTGFRTIARIERWVMGFIA